MTLAVGRTAVAVKMPARLIPGAEFFIIPNRDHMLATGDHRFKEAVLDFLRRRP